MKDEGQLLIAAPLFGTIIDYQTEVKLSDLITEIEWGHGVRVKLNLFYSILAPLIPLTSPHFKGPGICVDNQIKHSTQPLTQTWKPLQYRLSLSM